MNQTGKSRSSLFLIELILAVLFFSLGSGICIRAFSQASTISRSSADLSFASSQVSSAASVIRYCKDPAEAVAKFFPEASLEEDGFAVYYDDDRNSCNEADAAYVMSVQIADSDGFCTGHICMKDAKGTELYALELHYPAALEGENES